MDYVNDQTELDKNNRKRGKNERFSMTKFKPWHPSVRHVLSDRDGIVFSLVYVHFKDNNFWKIYKYETGDGDLYVKFQSHTPFCTTCRYMHLAKNKNCFLNSDNGAEIDFEDDTFYNIDDDLNLIEAVIVPKFTVLSCSAGKKGIVLKKE